MIDNIYYLTPRQDDIGHFIRLGHTGYRKLEDLHAAGRLSISRAVVDAAHITNQADMLLKGRGAKSFLACNDLGCCVDADQVQDMIKYHRVHALRQSYPLISNFNQTPESNWIDLLMRNHLEPVGRSLRKAEKIKLGDDALMKKIKDHGHRHDLIYQALDRLIKETEEIPYPMKPIVRHVEYPSAGKMR